MPLGACLESLADFSFAVLEGMGRKLWAGVGFAGSRGGALRLFFGNEEIGWEWRTSLWVRVSTAVAVCVYDAYPAGIGIQEFPEHAIFADLRHSLAAIEEGG